MRYFNIIKRTLSHHHSPTNSYIHAFNHLDREKLEETNNKMQNINVKIDKIDKEIKSLDIYIASNFVILNCIYMPLIFLNVI